MWCWIPGLTQPCPPSLKGCCQPAPGRGRPWSSRVLPVPPETPFRHSFRAPTPSCAPAGGLRMARITSSVHQWSPAEGGAPKASLTSVLVQNGALERASSEQVCTTSPPAATCCGGPAPLGATRKKRHLKCKPTGCSVCSTHVDGRIDSHSKLVHAGSSTQSRCLLTWRRDSDTGILVRPAPLQTPGSPTKHCSHESLVKLKTGLSL